MKRYSIFQKHKAKGNMTWYGRISESGLFHVVSLGTKKKADAVIKKCQNLAEIGTSWMMQGLNLRPAD